jgi:phosphatidylserine/phosphatidylglycerophosphate/cardiolipin synthase-like enzyme
MWLGGGFDPAHRIVRNQGIILDAQTAITGSFNSTDSADYQNAENLLLISSPALAQVYLQNWQLHRNHSTS